MACFRFLKYESRNVDEKRKIEDAIMNKLGRWKYSLDELVQKIPNELMQAIKSRWENAKKIAKHIFEQTLRQLMSSLSDKELKESMKKNEENITLKFNTCMILVHDIEHVVETATTTWKNV